MYNGERQAVSLYVFKRGENSTDVLLKACAEDFLARCGDDREVTNIIRGENGAPSFEGEGMPCISASHSGEYTVCAVSNGKVGVDLQIMRRYRDETAQQEEQRLLRVAKRFFHPKESSWIEQDPRGRFFTVWSAKEAYVKYTGEGIDETFASVSVIPDTGPYGSEWECNGMYYRSLPFDENYSFCVCCGNPIETETVFAEEL